MKNTKHFDFTPTTKNGMYIIISNDFKLKILLIDFFLCFLVDGRFN